MIVTKRTKHGIKGIIIIQLISRIQTEKLMIQIPIRYLIIFVTANDSLKSNCIQKKKVEADT